jgi:hypothetical protein
MANLDSRFICTSDLDSLYRDNASGLPLSGGIITFYSDVNRTTLKPVYQLTGTPGNYTYSPLPNPCVLSSAGTFQDALGNNIVPYYYPFTGTPSANTGVQELYYITCVNSGFAPQFVRQGWPQAAGSGVSPVSDNEVENYIPNGQFLAHNNILSITEPPIVQYTFGAQTVDAQQIAQGGWYFVYTDANSAVFNNSFQQIPSSGGWGMNSFPRYIFNFVCSSFNASALTRDLRIQWPDVNKFSSGNPVGETNFTLFFDAKSNDGNSYTFTLEQIYYFGTGGTPSAPVVTPITTFTVGPSESFVSYNLQDITFPSNAGTIGTNGDDYVALSIRGPASAWNAAFSDFALVQGNETLSSFPIQTNAEMLSRALAGWIPTPNPNGSSLYLTLKLGLEGFIYDSSEVGEIVAKSTLIDFNNTSISTISNELYCDGSQYLTAGYSPLGIPYSRLQAKLVYAASSLNLPIYGTGLNFASALGNNDADHILLMNNKYGSGANATDGTVMTGFTFNNNHADPGATVNVTAYMQTVVTGVMKGIITAMADTGTTGITFVEGRTGLINNYNIWQFNTTSVTISGLASTYFTYTANATNYYVWFKYNGSGTDPAPGGTGIQIDLFTGYSTQDLCRLIVFALNGGSMTDVICTAGSSITANSWFKFTTANGNKYYVWYNLGGGVDPAPAGFTLGIPVSITGTSTAAQVTAATISAINGTYFAVPDLRGLYLRGYDPNSTWDIDSVSRYGLNGNALGNVIGTLETDMFLTHLHGAGTLTAAPASGNFVTTSGSSIGTTSGVGLNTTLGTAAVSGSTALTGGYETTPVNMAIGYAIKY